ATRSRAWLNRCSLPEQGRDDPATLIAIPATRIGRIAIQTDSTRFGLIALAWSMISWAAYSLRVAAVLEYSSLRRRTARRQSRTAVTFEITSAHPDARSRNGARTITAVSAMTPMG